MEKIEVKAGRRTLQCDSSDKIMFNGACYILITKKVWAEWHEENPTISKTEFNRLKKLGVLSEPEAKKWVYNTVQIYSFKLPEA